MTRKAFGQIFTKDKSGQTSENRWAVQHHIDKQTIDSNLSGCIVPDFQQLFHTSMIGYDIESTKIEYF